ncbi:MAG: hypothetical protein ACRBEQ_08730 [Hyphomonas sp.]
MFGRRPRIDTTFGVPMDLDAPTGAMVKREDKPTPPTTILAPNPPIGQHNSRKTVQMHAPARSNTPAKPVSWSKPNASHTQDISGFAKYLRPPIGLRATTAIVIGTWIVLGPVIFFLAAAAYVGVAYVRWQKSLSSQ